MEKDRTGHGASLILVSSFQQWTVAAAVRLRPPRSKSNAHCGTIRGGGAAFRQALRPKLSGLAGPLVDARPRKGSVISTISWRQFYVRHGLFQRPLRRQSKDPVRRALEKRLIHLPIQRDGRHGLRPTSPSIGCAKPSRPVQTNLNKEGLAAASAAIVVPESPASVSVSPDESAIVVDVPPVECMSSAARSADWLIPVFI